MAFFISVFLKKKYYKEIILKYLNNTAMDTFNCKASRRKLTNNNK
jgi:hypothetical protein